MSDFAIANKRTTKNWYADEKEGSYYKLEKGMTIMQAAMNADGSRETGSETEVDDGDMEFYARKVNELLNLSYEEEKVKQNG